MRLIFAVIFYLLFFNVTDYAFSAQNVLSRDRIVHLNVECLSFSGETKTLSLDVLDTVKDDVLEIFTELRAIEFPIYTVSCYAPRNIRGGVEKISLHAYAAAIDINYLMNPYYDAANNIIISDRNSNLEKDPDRIIDVLRFINDISENKKDTIKEVIKIFSELRNIRSSEEGENSEKNLMSLEDILRNIGISEEEIKAIKSAKSVRDGLNGISEKERDAIFGIIIQPIGSDDRFLNRGIIRKGMITSAVVDIFKEHGFNEWGGNWRQPMDYMHFQLPRSLAEQLANSDFELSKKIWEDHKAKIREGMPFFKRAMSYIVSFFRKFI